MAAHVLANRYQVIELIGKGGMASVWRGFDQTLGRLVAVKTMKPELAVSPRFAEQFLKEARSAARLNDPHIVSVYDWGVDRGNCYIVMELVDGFDLRSMLKQQGDFHPEAAALLACALLATGCGTGSSAASMSSSAPVTPSSSSSSSAIASASTIASQSSSASAKSAVEVSNVQLEQDAIGRYVLTATVANNGDETLDVELTGKAGLTKREKNKYDEEEEYTSIEKISDSDVVTPWASGGSSIDVLGLESGEKRELAIYPTTIGSNLSAMDCTADKPELTISEVTLTSEADKLSDVPDFDGDLKVEIISFDGKKVSGTVTNNTGKYLNNAELTFTKWDSNNLPVTNEPWKDKRPTGANLAKESVKNLKPDAVAEFSTNLGDCNTVQLKDAYYDVDQAKS